MHPYFMVRRMCGYKKSIFIFIIFITIISSLFLGAPKFMSSEAMTGGNSWVLYSCTGTVVSVDESEDTADIMIIEAGIISDDVTNGKITTFDFSSWGTSDSLETMKSGDSVEISFFNYKNSRGSYQVRSITPLD